MPTEAWFCVATLTVAMALLAAGVAATEIVMLGALLAQVLLGVVDLPQAAAGFAHPAVLMIAALFVVAAGLTETGATQMIAQSLLGRPTGVAAAQLRLMAPVAALSAFLNNTPIVAMYLPIVNDWARKIRVSPSKLYLPLSFAAILGGRITLIGSSSNLVVMGQYRQLWESSPDVPPLSSTAEFWGPAALGLPAAILGIAYILLFSRWLLPERKPAVPTTVDARRYTVQMEVRPDSPIVGKSIEQAGLRHLPGLYLAEIERDGQSLPAPSPGAVLEANDRLSFAGILESVVDLRKIRGLVPATNQVDKISGPESDRALVEAVVAHNSPLVGRTVRASRFRTTYNAAIIAVHRNGGQVKAKVGDIQLRPGDTLLLDTHRGFVDGYRNSDDFYLVSAVQGATHVRHEKAKRALAIFIATVLLLAFSSIPPAVIALTAALAMVVSGCVAAGVARASINLQVIVVIACALGLGAGMRESGAADTIARWLLTAANGMGFGATAMLAAIALLTALFAQVLTNNGAAALMFPIAMATAHDLGVSTAPFAFVLLMGCGLNFLTPIGYQTNLMVYGPGGYRFLDFTRIGLPLTLLLAAMGALLAPVFFPF
ncbi:MAG: SLC13 family permease [Acidobacteria bacterium]|nr:SLC13 family permease [Acidobacteriota bacterium]